VVFAIILGVIIDHLLRWWHKRLGRHDHVESGQEAGKESAAEQDARAEREAVVEIAPLAVPAVVVVETRR
jgi:hypothetical protein